MGRRAFGIKILISAVSKLERNSHGTHIGQVAGRSQLPPGMQEMLNSSMSLSHSK